MASRAFGLLLLAGLVTGGGTPGCRVMRVPVEKPAPRLVVNDVTQLNPIAVSELITPTTTQEIVEAVKGHPGPISIGGARHSMGGQTATEGSLYIDMRRFDRILDFSPAQKTITVQAGARWRQIQERIDRANLSVQIMQSYSNFTVGGSLSVNAHGRYTGLGPIIISVKSLKAVLADGSVVEASRTRHSDVFDGMIGGYGGLGVITEATLELVDNVPVKRSDLTMPITDYRRYYFEHVRENASAVFHNADIYPGSFTTVRAVTYEKTDGPVTRHERLIPTDAQYRFSRLGFWIVSEWPLGGMIRRRIVDPMRFRGEPVSWRNYEASHDVAELEPASRSRSTYVLQEYFVPVARFDEFVPKMRSVFQRHDPHIINVSIRHSNRDPGSILAWARTEVFSFVVYYKQGTDAEAKEAVGVWTRELIDAVLSVDGAYYLPYQNHATQEQFERAYPRFGEFFALKRRLDPSNKFRNKLWDKYYRPQNSPGKTLR